VVADDHHKLTIHNRKKDLSVFRQFIRALILFQLNRYKVHFKFPFTVLFILIKPIFRF
jgi:hypothetical protein